VAAKATISSLKAEITNLSRLAEAGSAMSLAEDATLAELMRQKEELLRERDVQVGGGGGGGGVKDVSSTCRSSLMVAASLDVNVC
jgi:hypothetical protein